MRKMGILLGRVGACRLLDLRAAPPAPVDLNNPLMAPGFMAQAASADQFEIQSSQLALQASQNAGVRNFANMIIADHGRSAR